MRIKRSKEWACVFLLIFLAVCLSAQERIEWEPVAGADYYLVEIRQNGGLVLETRSEEPFIPLFLPPGNYDIQIKVVDAFGNIKSTSESSRLRISAPLTPFIVDVFPQIIHEGAKKKPVFFARVSGLLESEERSTNFALENAEGEKIQLGWKASDSNKSAEGWKEISLSAGNKPPDSGTWHLIMTNPDGREDRFKNALTINLDSRPQVKSINPKEFVAGIPNAVLRVRAKGFSGDATLLIDGPSEIPVAKLNQGEEDAFEFSLDLRNASEGNYLVSLINPLGETDIEVRKLRIRAQKTTSSGKALKIDEKSPRPLSEFPNAIYVGWKPIIRIGSIDLVIPEIVSKPGYLGFTLGYSRDIENDLLRRVPYLDGLEWNFSLNYVQNKLVDQGVNFEGANVERPLQGHHNLALLFGISYTTWFEFPLNFLAQAGLGVGGTLREFTGEAPGEAPPEEPPEEPPTGIPSDTEVRDPSSDELFNPKNSISFIMSFDLGLRWDITPRVFINAAANAMVKSDIGGSNELSIQPKIEGGWRW